jgi:hypothetical protein
MQEAPLRPDPTAHHLKLIGVAGLIAVSSWAASISTSSAVFVMVPECGLASQLQVDVGVIDAHVGVDDAGVAGSLPRLRELDSLEAPPRRCGAPPFSPLLVAPKHGPPLS